ncbi:MAG: hypothetical protein ABII21_04045 [bacterium]
MTILELWHGSHTKRLDSIVPNKSSLPTVFASSSVVVAAFFTSYPRKFSFMVDQMNYRVYLPSAEDLVTNDNGGSVYRVVGDFTPASDRLIYEFEAPRATIIEETEIDSAVAFVTSLGFQVYADSAIHNWAYFYQQEHMGQFPSQLPEQAYPFSK